MVGSRSPWELGVHRNGDQTNPVNSWQPIHRGVVAQEDKDFKLFVTDKSQGSETVQAEVQGTAPGSVTSHLAITARGPKLEPHAASLPRLTRVRPNQRKQFLNLSRLTAPYPAPSTRNPVLGV